MTLTFLLSGDAHGTPCPPLPTALHAPVCVDFGWFKALGVLCERSMWSAKFCSRVLIRKGKWVRDCCSSSAPQMQWSRLKLKDRILLSHWEVNLISSTPTKWICRTWWIPFEILGRSGQSIVLKGWHAGCCAIQPSFFFDIWKSVFLTLVFSGNYHG